MSTATNTEENDGMKSFFIGLAVFITIIFAVIGLVRANNNADARFSQYDPKVANTLGYVELRVPDIERSIKFYREIIGLKTTFEADNYALLAAADDDPILALTEDADAPARPAGATRLYHLAILLPSRKDLALTLQHLTESKYPMQGSSDHLYSEALYLADPDGNGIEIYSDRNPSQWKQDGRGGYVGGSEPLNISNLMAEIKVHAWNGLPTGTKLGHMHLQVASIEESERFYTKGLGFDIVTKMDNVLFVSNDRYHHHIGMNTWNGEGAPSPPKNALGMDYFTIRLTKSEYAQVRKDLTELGYQFTELDNVITVPDPSGNTIRVTDTKDQE